MPSKTPKQAKFMRAIAHGWTPSRMKSPPSRAVAQEFVEADRKYSGGFAENRYWVGGLAAMDEVNAGYKGSINNPLRWQEGGYSEGEVPYREQLRQHQEKIAATLGSARGGHVNYYEEGGEARPGHGEGPNPYEGDPLLRKSYARWEKKHHIDPSPPPPPEPEPEPEEIPWYKKLVGYGTPSRTEKELAEMEQAYGGYVGYQAGGLAVAAPGRILPPAGGVPPWIEPVGSGPGFSEPEPEGYQFGGMAARMGPAMRGAARQYRGVPPQRGGIQRGAPPGGGRGFLAQNWGQNRQPRGGLAAMMRQARQQQAGAAGGLTPGGPGYDPGGPGTWAGRGGIPGGGMPRGGVMGGQYDPGGSRPLPPGGIPNDFPGLDPYSEGELRRRGPRGPMAPGGGGGPLQLPIMDRPNPNIGRPGYDPIGDMAPIYNRRGPIPTRFGGAGKPQPGPGMMPPRQVPPSPPGGGGEITGGPRVPPNMRGYLQRMRMQNRPPTGPGGGGENRVGMADQQGAYARAMQRGTGRAPPSRRMGFGRAGRRR